jgi:fructose-1,6-bisphosphatase
MPTKSTCSTGVRFRFVDSKAGTCFIALTVFSIEETTKSHSSNASNSMDLAEPSSDENVRVLWGLCCSTQG